MEPTESGAELALRGLFRGITGGLRKVCWATNGRGKSGGVRVIYFYVTGAAQIRLIAIYKKGVKDDLNAAEKKVLKKLNENW